jgi:hypothetical protein
MKIIGAGLAGLLAGALNPKHTIYEAQGSLPNNHGAVLRFRSDEISKALGIPFKQVQVTKAIWYDGKERDPTPRMQNFYSNKVLQEYSSRSIRDIDPVTRWIAPKDFTYQLAQRCNIMFNRPWPEYGDSRGSGEPIISTMPMLTLLKILKMPEQTPFHNQPIWTAVYEFPKSVDLYQTIYFPGPETQVYRASFTGNKMICEAVSHTDVWNMRHITSAFGLRPDCYVAQAPSVKKQKYGKIVDIDHNVRRSIMAQLTHEHNIYSLGRYATWRNILLDDVYHDIFKIRDLMSLDDYSRRLKLAEEK